MKKHWIAGAIKHPGALRDTAKADGMVKGDAPLTTTILGKLSKSKSPVTRKRADLAKTLKGMNG